MSDNQILIDDLCGHMQLKEEEKGGVCIEEPENDVQSQEFRWCLVGRFLMGRQINFMAIKNRIALIWRPVKGVFIKELRPNLFLFQFFHELDITRVQSNGLWTFDNALLLKKKVGKSIGNFIGTYLDSDQHSFNGVWQNYMRIRVVIDVRSLIKRRMKLTKPDGEWV
ncbi:hypothetical protein DH2020_027699 [Rehmannia glutinosa]|uniref:DUF4283 domain-containing protein n=1 Tax=Rehmannia glutinosa TaxID=99300 RepID=A0ABR0VUE9_REHGL